ncbi:EAL domain-containing response regulator [Pseudomonas citronellolis]|uniref:EAL domain-containing response regulator n=1 Tax=Pseudomonas citronellolis TaxID=53408 RepID=UPI0023E35388|nr:EAL domain-containing response regulator [Pseudomonas citronellolis]MDF3931051.1 EAL domain-containing response regulator [Pseudomonas citronellolis]
MNTSTPPSLLVLEDHAFLREATVHGLQVLGYERVLAAADGDSAMEQLRQHGGVEIAICDVRLPGMDLITFLRLAAHEQLVRAIVVVSDIPADLRRAIVHIATLHGLAVIGELSKPLQIGFLQARLKQYCTEPGETPKENRPTPSALEVWRAMRNQELKAYYQPKVNLDTLETVGAEVLVRWDHPVHGLLRPAYFLAAVRQMKLLPELFEQVLTQALAFARGERQQGRCPDLSINMDLEVLQQSNLAASLEERLRQSGVEPSSLTIEIIEGGLAATPLASLENLTRLRLLGCNISIDDFGTGYSSLQRLCDLPCNEIKLDASFIRDMQENPRAYESIASTMALARHLKLRVVAEGIESPQQLQRLRELGCQLGQGFLFAEPLSEHEFRNWPGAQHLPMAVAGHARLDRETAPHPPY